MFVGWRTPISQNSACLANSPVTSGKTKAEGCVQGHDEAATGQPKVLGTDQAAWRITLCTGAALQEETLKSEWEEKGCCRRTLYQTPSHAVTAAAPAFQTLAGSVVNRAAGLGTNRPSAEPLRLSVKTMRANKCSRHINQ